jgi:hypothetical protein
VGDKESTRAAIVAGDLQILIEEILALALDGAPEAALRRAEAYPAGATDSAAGVALTCCEAGWRYATDRSTARRGRPRVRIAGGCRLRLASSPELARCWAAGKVTEAATVLRQALEEFRGSPSFLRSGDRGLSRSSLPARRRRSTGGR